MELEEKYRIAIEALQRIGNFGHNKDCNSSAPIHECGCYDMSEQQMAQKCLETLGEE